eukprot:CAMPEP_0194254698 /NCGR_PEP_ID=MMETSP0158-20130606/32738_1 /TAXON_ID=33649 /ORGANISM="Thalassionema nitzschioides, Strain L26-B" /LENGTH=220 /DNA_ID=CAMNT_0038992827 /DNA_START=153 /DNA_END=811 /DNA_ORIENTATION=-
MRAYITAHLFLSLLAALAKVDGLTNPRQSQPVPRRAALLKGISAIASGAAYATVISPQAAVAASVPTPEEIKRLQIGHARISYLLKNWDKITTFCGKDAETATKNKQVVKTEDGGGGGNSCEKTPLVIQEYLGFKSVNDPLFKADKLMVRAAPLADDPVDFLESVERYREKSDMVSLMAYTSSWTGANQGFGVEDTLDQTKTDVIITEKILREILGMLNL